MWGLWMKKMKSNAKYILLLILLLLVYYLPLGEIVSKYVVSKYLSCQYPNELIIEYKFHDYKNLEHVLEVIDKHQGTIFTTISYYWQKGFLYDDRFSVKINKEYTEGLTQLINNNIINIQNISYFSAKSLHHLSIWPVTNKNGIIREDRLRLVIKNDPSHSPILTKEEFLELAIEIVNNAKEINPNIFLDISYLDSSFSKDNSYLLQLKSEQIDLPKEELILFITNPWGDAWK